MRWRRGLILAALGLVGCGGGGGTGTTPAPEPTYDARSAGLGEPVFATLGAAASLRFEGAAAGEEYWLILASLAAPPGTATVVVNGGTATLPLLPELQVPSRRRDRGPEDLPGGRAASRQAALPDLGSTRGFSVTAVGGRRFRLRSGRSARTACCMSTRPLQRRTSRRAPCGSARPVRRPAVPRRGVALRRARWTWTPTGG